MGPYIVDFYCPEARLVIELDGGGHALQVSHDQNPSEFLAQTGNRVIRFWNGDVLGNIEGVAGAILKQLTTPAPPKTPSPQSSPEKGEEVRTETYRARGPH